MITSTVWPGLQSKFWLYSSQYSIDEYSTRFWQFNQWLVEIYMKGNEALELLALSSGYWEFSRWQHVSLYSCYILVILFHLITAFFFFFFVQIGGADYWQGQGSHCKRLHRYDHWWHGHDHDDGHRWPFDSDQTLRFFDVGLALKIDSNLVT